MTIRCVGAFAKKICDALSPWVLRDIEALKYSSSPHVPALWVVQASQCATKNIILGLSCYVMSLNFFVNTSNFRAFFPMFLRENYQCPTTRLFALGAKRLKILGTEGVKNQSHFAKHRSDARRSGGRTQNRSGHKERKG